MFKIVNSSQPSGLHGILFSQVSLTSESADVVRREDRSVIGGAMYLYHFNGGRQIEKIEIISGGVTVVTLKKIEFEKLQQEFPETARIRRIAFGEPDPNEPAQYRLILKL